MKELFSKLLAHLRAMALYSQTAHWTAKGAPFFGDHLLFERLYGAINEEIDGLAEKAVGLTGGATVSLPLSLQLIHDQVAELPENALDNLEAFKALGMMEQEFITLCTHAEAVEDATLGFKNLMADLADRSEGRFYLIKQRLLKG